MDYFPSATIVGLDREDVKDVFEGDIHFVKGNQRDTPPPSRKDKGQDTNAFREP